LCPVLLNVLPRAAALAVTFAVLALAACAPTPQAPDSAASPAAQAPTAVPRSGSDTDLILATTTSTQDSGLLDVLVPVFSRQSGYQVKTVSIGTGAALALGGLGEADVVLVHAPESEKQWMAQGKGTERLLVMHNDFILVGPSDDSAKLSRDKYDQSLFVPDAGKQDSDVGG
jgi:tungstate transport system substrate-binding protein